VPEDAFDEEDGAEQGSAAPGKGPGTETSTPPEEEAAPEAATPSPGSRPTDEVRKELRDYISGVRQRLNGAPGQPANPGALLDYLAKLSDYLPESERRRFKGSTERLTMEYLKAQLAGKRGLRKSIGQKFPPGGHEPKEPLSRSRVVETFSFLSGMANHHPDRAIGAAMVEQIGSLVARLRSSG